ncbi:hypothetical protein LS684_18820 [Cytobacillus spongiae]|uniref:hypothetical protein n=1 Tax=Cytobacillus spongiae TaxID=2901381 RepID=UPI001F1709C9|nr:hypothetical protein [Cytobacillus spongiae]UII55654.1 hypothetical protein LS684_18820 [Cytobacillus spongiae]
MGPGTLSHLDVGGVFAPYIKTCMEQGSQLERQKLLMVLTQTSLVVILQIYYRRLLFIIDNVYLQYAESVSSISSTSFSISLEEAAPEDYTARNVWDMFMVDIELEDVLQYM